jgi:diguanylate cyclase (GGDEF)-like protein
MQGEPAVPRRPLDPPGVVRRIAPFAAAALLSFIPLILPPENRDKTPIIAAFLVLAVVVAAAVVIPWPRLPAWTQAIPAISFFFVVALLRDAEGGGESGYGPLLLLPVFWLSLYGTRLQVLVSTLAAAATLAIPILVEGAPRYPPSEWRRTIVWLAIAPVIGFTVQGLVRTIERLARTDSLTGLPNRRCWEESLREAMSRASRRSDPISIAILDLDHFKRFNDTKGHPAGDRLIAAAASAWNESLRSGDMVARLGGEEFGALMHHTTLVEAEVAVERLRKATPEGQTTSAGIAQWDGSETSRGLFQRADEALYAAKQGGRDRSVSSSRGSSTEGLPQGARKA